MKAAVSRRSWCRKHTAVTPAGTACLGNSVRLSFFLPNRTGKRARACVTQTPRVRTITMLAFPLEEIQGEKFK